MTRRMTSHLANSLASLLLFVILLAAACSAARADSDDGIVRVKSAVPMAEAIGRIKADIAAKGIKFFDEIDQSKLAADAGIKLDRIFTHRWKLDQAAEAYRVFDAQSSGKGVIEF